MRKMIIRVHVSGWSVVLFNHEILWTLLTGALKKMSSYPSQGSELSFQIHQLLSCWVNLFKFWTAWGCVSPLKTCGGHLKFEENLELTCTSPYHGKCDCKFLIISDFKFLTFCIQKKYEVDPWWPFWISVKTLKKSHAHFDIVGNVIGKCE